MQTATQTTQQNDVPAIVRGHMDCELCLNNFGVDFVLNKLDTWLHTQQEVVEVEQVMYYVGWSEVLDAYRVDDFGGH